ncbi:MAG: hypothetical protein Q7U92_25115, partial [Bradyrhizobium sp.]|nr:hypothetical protein [Bradyrhizobium sp.]
GITWRSTSASKRARRRDHLKAGCGDRIRLFDSKVVINSINVIASEAKQSSFLEAPKKEASWIASSQALLAMTL